MFLCVKWICSIWYSRDNLFTQLRIVVDLRLEMACDQKLQLWVSDQLGNSGQVKRMCKHSPYSQHLLAVGLWAGHSVCWLQWSSSIAEDCGCTGQLPGETVSASAWIWSRGMLKKTQHAQQNLSMNNGLKTNTFSPSKCLPCLLCQLFPLLPSISTTWCDRGLQRGPKGHPSAGNHKHLFW